jgi:ABC-type transport system substrate-binding protein
VLYTCNFPTCAPQAQLVKNDLARIGLRVAVKSVAPSVIYGRAQKRTYPFDLALVNWLPDYPDPAAMLDGMLDNASYYPTFQDPTFRRRMAAAAHLSGPARDLTYGKLALDLARDAAPLIVYGNALESDFFSARVGCQTYNSYVGPDLAALCIRSDSR